MEVTTGIATALALGAVAGLKPVAEQAIKDGYAALKGLINRKYGGVNVGQLEANPRSADWQAVVARELERAGAQNDPEVLSLAEMLLDLIGRSSGTARAAAIDLENIESSTLAIRRVLVSGPTALRMRDSKIDQIIVEDLAIPKEDQSPKG